MKINWTRYGNTAACALFYGMFLVHLMPVTVAHAIGPNLCDGTDPDYPDWSFPYACDLDVSYADQFLITDARDTYSFYASVDSYDIHRLDVFYPPSCLQSQDCKVFINIHGGAWKDYYKTMIDGPENLNAQNASWYMTGKKGWIVIVPDYRLCDREVYTAESCPEWPPSDPQTCQDPRQAAVYPDNVNDINLIVDWVYRNAYRYGAKNTGPEHLATDIWLMGHSAGGHLVMDWATNPAFSGERHKVQGVIGLSGAYDIKNLSPLLTEAVNNTFKAHDGKTGAEWQAIASPTVNLKANPDNPYPRLMILDCGESDLANLGDPVTIGVKTYPDNAQEFADLFRTYGYRVAEDPAEQGAELWHIQLDPGEYDHVDEYAALSYTGDNSDPAYFERLYLPWVPQDERDCTNNATTLGPNNLSEINGDCNLLAKPEAGTWDQPTDLIVRWIESSGRASSSSSMLLRIVPVLSSSARSTE